MTPLGLGDTTLFIAAEADRPLDWSALPERICVSIITIGELRAGVLAATDLQARHQRLATLVAALSLDPMPVDERVADAWAKLRLLLRDSGQRMPVNDSWIAATAMSMDVPLVTQDDDHVEVPGLQVLKV